MAGLPHLRDANTNSHAKNQGRLPYTKNKQSQVGDMVVTKNRFVTFYVVRESGFGWNAYR